MFTSNNVILYSLSRNVRDRFTAVASCYGDLYSYALTYDLCVFMFCVLYIVYRF